MHLSSESQDMAFGAPAEHEYVIISVCTVSFNMGWQMKAFQQTQQSQYDNWLIIWQSHCICIGTKST